MLTLEANNELIDGPMSAGFQKGNGKTSWKNANFDHKNGDDIRVWDISRNLRALHFSTGLDLPPFPTSWDSGGSNMSVLHDRSCSSDSWATFVSSLRAALATASKFGRHNKGVFTCEIGSKINHGWAVETLKWTETTIPARCEWWVRIQTFESLGWVGTTCLLQLQRHRFPSPIIPVACNIHSMNQGSRTRVLSSPEAKLWSSLSSFSSLTSLATRTGGPVASWVYMSLRHQS